MNCTQAQALIARVVTGNADPEPLDRRPPEDLAVGISIELGDVRPVERPA